ncbi:MAG: 4-hydroxythreonine-4-phosphate dehydrogenase PdxA [Candidatus Omnitrophota bacterium]
MFKSIIITMGDPAGIGPEVTVKALLSPRIRPGVRFVLVGDSFVWGKIPGYRRLVASGRAEIVDLANVCRKGFCWGRVRREYGQAAREYLDVALDLLKRRNLSGLVTAPLNKEAVALSCRGFSGQTEYLAHKTSCADFAMFLANARLKIALVTRHIPLQRVAARINTVDICRVVKLTEAFLRRFYRIRRPRIALSGLNPHSSDNGLIGREEAEKIAPAIAILKKTIRCCGPYPVDTLFKLALRRPASLFHAAVVMYHDQALIPLKISGEDSGVNITLGLPFVRVSPLHGVAFDIAGRNRAAASSMIAAINTAARSNHYRLIEAKPR